MNIYKVSTKNENIFMYINGPNKGKWFFGDETENENGPYTTEDEAYTAFKDYCEKYL
jgi:hypothetical protein